MTSNELLVAYPGREGAHSAVACDRLFPAARLVALPPSDRGRRDAVATAVAAPTASFRSRAHSRGRSTRPTICSSTRHSRSSPKRSSRSATVSSASAAIRSRTTREILSHPMALDQCRNLLARSPRHTATVAPTTATRRRRSPSSGTRPSRRSRASEPRSSTPDGARGRTSATTRRPLRASPPSRPTRGSTAATAPGGPPSRS